MKSVLDSRQLLAARVLADTGSFTLAGQQLSLTQSAVSHTIKALEEQVECVLFTRGGKGVTVTPAGRHFLEYADRILAQMEMARTLVAPRHQRGRERLRLGVSVWSHQHILPVVLPAFKREFPNQLVMVEAGDNTHNLALLGSGLLDLTFTVRPVNRPDLEFLLLFEDELHFVVAPDHPWARLGQALPADLAGNTLLLHPGDYNMPVLLEEYFRLKQLVPRHAVEIVDTGTLKTLVKTGLAVGVLPTGRVKDELDEGSLVAVSLGANALVQPWGVVFQRHRQLSPREKRLVELYHQAVAGIVGRPRAETPEPPPSPKEPSLLPSVPEPFIRCSHVALLAASAYNFMSASTAWVYLGSSAMAAS